MSIELEAGPKYGENEAGGANDGSSDSMSRSAKRLKESPNAPSPSGPLGKSSSSKHPYGGPTPQQQQQQQQHQGYGYPHQGGGAPPPHSQYHQMPHSRNHPPYSHSPMWQQQGGPPPPPQQSRGGPWQQHPGQHGQMGIFRQPPQKQDPYLSSRSPSKGAKEGGGTPRDGGNSRGGGDWQQWSSHPRGPPVMGGGPNAPPPHQHSQQWGSPHRIGASGPPGMPQHHMGGGAPSSPHRGPQWRQGGSSGGPPGHPSMCYPTSSGSSAPPGVLQTPQGRSTSGGGDDGMSEQDSKEKSRNKGRGKYVCGRCGKSKKGHICPYQPKLKRRPDEPPPEMTNAAAQVELDEYMVLRRLNLEIQGFPESYADTPPPDDLVGADSYDPRDFPPPPPPPTTMGGFGSGEMRGPR